MGCDPTAGRTIAAVATPPGLGALAIVRMTGETALQICDRVFRGKHVPSRLRDRSAIVGEIIDRGGAPIDQVLVLVMRGPETATGEDVVEITCHGGLVAPRRVLRRLVEEGACPAEAGEFTKRAFLNHKIDLTQAEAVCEIVHASSEKALRVALRQLGGGLSEELTRIEEPLARWLTLIEANIDFPEEEIQPVEGGALADAVSEACGALDALLEAHDKGKYLKQAIDVVIVGRPNVGKSSLFNRLVGADRVIVSGTPGTTRDVIEGLVSVDGVVLRLHDTAGVRPPADHIDAEAVRRTRRTVAAADISIVVVDAGAPATAEDLAIVEETAGMPQVRVLNKIDLGPGAGSAGESEAFGGAMKVSALKGWGIAELAAAVGRLAASRMEDLDYEIVVNERHARCIGRAREALDGGLRAIQEGLPLELVASDLRCALDALGEITGRRVAANILDEIFSRFCIGK